MDEERGRNWSPAFPRFGMETAVEHTALAIVIVLEERVASLLESDPGNGYPAPFVEYAAASTAPPAATAAIDGRVLHFAAAVTQSRSISNHITRPQSATACRAEGKQD
jgi:hypothetical protein